MNIELTTSPKEEDAKTISQGIIDYNQAEIPELEPNGTNLNSLLLS